MGNVEDQEEVGVIQNAKVKMLNIFLLGLVFCFLFTGFNTMSGIQTLIFNSATNKNSGGFVPGFSVSANKAKFYLCIKLLLFSNFSP